MNRLSSLLGCIACLAICFQPTVVIAGTGEGNVVSITKIQDSGPDNQRFNIVIMGDGYQTSEMSSFEARAQEVVTSFNNQTVYGACQSAVNFYRVNIESDDSGVDKPTPCYGFDTLRDTYLDTKYCGDGLTQRCIGSSDSALISTTASSATTNWHLALVLVNETEHGGCRWGTKTYSSTQSGFQNTVIHELGHGIGDLADEYEEFKNTYSGVEPFKANVTIATNRSDLKWRDLLLGTTPLPTWEKTDCNASQNPPTSWGDTVGVFEGGNRHYTCGIYRAQRTCLMRSSSQPFCAVCSKKLSQELMALSSDADLSITPWGYYQEPKVNPYWQTVDIWADNNGNSVQEADEPSIGKADNHLFARVTNNGDGPSGTFDVSFYYVPFTGVIDMANRQHIQTVSRPSLASGLSDEVEALWDLTSVPPQFAGIEHFCVIVEIDANECVTYNNRAQNNFNQIPTVGPSPAPMSLYVKNILPQAATGRLVIEPRPAAWEIEANVPSIDSIPLQPNEEKLITVEFSNDTACGGKPRGEGGFQRICARQDFDVSFELEGDTLGGVSSEIIVQRSRRSFSFHAGSTFPTGDLDRFFGPGLMLALDLDYRLTQKWSILGLVGYHEFSGDAPGVSDTHLWNVAVNGKVELGSGLVRPYFNGGLGLYIPESGSTEPGANAGFGLLRNLTSRTIFEAGVDYHRIFVSGEDLEYYVGKIGLLWNF